MVEVAIRLVLLVVVDSIVLHMSLIIWLNISLKNIAPKQFTAIPLLLTKNNETRKSNAITFAKQVKEELVSSVFYSKERLIALLSAYIRINGVISFFNKKTQIQLKSDNAKIIKFIYSSLKDNFKDYEITLDYYKKSNRSKNMTYRLYIKDADNLLEELSVSYFEGKIYKDIVYNDETISGYLAGAFLASGSINSPETINYHLEISTVSENYAKWLSKLFSKYHMKVRKFTSSEGIDERKEIMEAAQKAVRCIDECVEKVVNKIKEYKNNKHVFIEKN